MKNIGINDKVLLVNQKEVPGGWPWGGWDGAGF